MADFWGNVKDALMSSSRVPATIGGPGGFVETQILAQTPEGRQQLKDLALTSGSLASGILAPAAGLGVGGTAAAVGGTRSAQGLLLGESAGDAVSAGTTDAALTYAGGKVLEKGIPLVVKGARGAYDYLRSGGLRTMRPGHIVLSEPSGGVVQVNNPLPDGVGPAKMKPGMTRLPWETSSRAMVPSSLDDVLVIESHRVPVRDLPDMFRIPHDPATVWQGYPEYAKAMNDLTARMKSGAGLSDKTFLALEPGDSFVPLTASDTATLIGANSNRIKNGPFGLDYARVAVSPTSLMNSGDVRMSFAQHAMDQRLAFPASSYFLATEEARIPGYGVVRPFVRVSDHVNGLLADGRALSGTASSDVQAATASPFVPYVVPTKSVPTKSVPMELDMRGIVGPRLTREGARAGYPYYGYPARYRIPGTNTQSTDLYGGVLLKPSTPDLEGAHLDAKGGEAADVHADSKGGKTEGTRESLESLVERRYREMMNAPVTVRGKEYPTAWEARYLHALPFTGDQAAKGRFDWFMNAAGAALRADARNSVLLDEYNRQAEVNRPKEGDQKLYDALIEKGRAKYAGGEFARVLTTYSTPRQETPKPDRSYKGPTYDEVHGSGRKTTPPKAHKQDDWDKIVNAPTGVIVDMHGNRLTTTAGGGLRNATAEEIREARRQNASGDLPKVQYRKIDPFGVMQAAKAGDAGGSGSRAAVPKGRDTAPDGYRGPRIVVNPKVFHDKRDALCVAMNEAFRILMEEMGFNPVSEPTDAQRRFFADTAYADDETMLRRTIIARICTFDTSIS